MGVVIQLQGDQRKDVQEFLTSDDGLGLKVNTIKVCSHYLLFFTNAACTDTISCRSMGSRHTHARASLRAASKEN